MRFWPITEKRLCSCLLGCTRSFCSTKVLLLVVPAGRAEGSTEHCERPSFRWILLKVTGRQGQMTQRGPPLSVPMLKPICTAVYVIVSAIVENWPLIEVPLIGPMSANSHGTTPGEFSCHADSARILAFGPSPGERPLPRPIRLQSGSLHLCFRRGIQVRSGSLRCFSALVLSFSFGQTATTPDEKLYHFEHSSVAIWPESEYGRSVSLASCRTLLVTHGSLRNQTASLTS